MKDEYYTPELEEFHPGFVYEMCLRNKEGATFWQRRTVGPQGWQGIWNIPFSINKGYRVKYLDREDIESLGFVFKVGTESSYIKDNITMHVYDAKRWNTENDTITMFKKDLIRAVGKTIVFSGTIKNKSELKRLLKMLGIYE